MKKSTPISKVIKNKQEAQPAKVSGRIKDPFKKLKGAAKGRFTTKDILDMTRPW